MTYVLLVIVGLAMGSFVNALVWRIEQQGESKKSKKRIKNRTVDLSISKGRSVCVHCGHELSALDLIPVISWLSLGGKCRYCRKPIEDSPLVELATMAAFLVSYVAWPFELAHAAAQGAFVAWLAIVVCLVALFVYDLRHMILPNRIVFPMMAIAVIYRLFLFAALDESLRETLMDAAVGVGVGGGLFYLLFIVSGGRWIGGGDVKLGFVIGILLGPINALVSLLLAFYIAAFFILPLMAIKKVNRKSRIPFGPFLIIGLFLAQLWSVEIRDWYDSLFGL